MVAFAETTEPEKMRTSVESPAETAVNTAEPSRAPSPVLPRTPNNSSDIETGEPAEKILTQAEAEAVWGEDDRHPSLKCVDPVTHIVGWDGPDDPENPMNFPFSKKVIITVITAMMTFCVSFASSVFSTATTVLAVKFHVSLEVMILGVSLYVLGFACGPLVWGPLSEVYGRTRPLMIGFFIFAVFQIPVAVAQNIENVMLARFLGGCFGAAPIAIVGGTYVDFWSVLDRGIATAGFSGAVFIGPIAGPIVGEYLIVNSLGWRWTAWITLIMSAFFGILGLIFVPETYAPVLLKWRAEKIRHETKNWAVHAEIDEKPVHFKSLMQTYFAKPWIMIVQEPILLAMTLYSAFVYSVLYLIFFAYPYSFQIIRGWKTGVASLPFLGLFVGILVCCVYVAIDTKVRYNKALIRSKKFVLPEARLPPMIVGSFVLPIGLFWFAWTSDPTIPWPAQVVSSVLIGCGIFLVFLPSQIYIVDCYLLNANSALAASACVRALMAAGFPLFSEQMYERLGVNWATSLLAFLCVAMLPFPILFWKYGEKLRQRGKFAFAL